MMMENGLSMEYGDGYMEQEEEWEREGLLDPAWEKQQKKVSNHILYMLPSFNYNYLVQTNSSRNEIIRNNRFS